MNEVLLEKIREYEVNTSPLPKIVVIYGPTACGKTALSIDVARYLDTEIISADSRQIYQEMDIGTGKVTKEEMQWVPHHMLDIISPKEVFSMAEYAKMALPIIERIQKSGKIPVLCGGTWLYIDAVLYEMDLPDVEPDWVYREELEKIRLEKGNEHLWKMLEAVDPVYAGELESNNFRYVMRWLEVIRETGRSKRESYNTKELRYNPLFLTPYRDSPSDRQELYERINARVQTMFDSWLTEEVWYIIDTFTSSCPGLTTIGYREVVDAIEWWTTFARAIELVQQKSRNYAKRQITWNKKYG